MSHLRDLNLTLADVDLGSIDAESDHNLANHFIKTTYATGILDARREYVLGRKGSGKSALFQQLESVVPQGTVVHKVTPENVWSTLRMHEDHGNPNRDAAYVAAWSFVLATLTAQALINHDPNLPESAARAFGPARRFLEHNFPQGTSPVAAARGFVKKIRSFNLEAFGIAAGVTWEPEETNEVAALVVDKVMEAMRPAIQHVGVVIALDQVDEGWDGGPESKSMMIGLVRAAKKLNDKYGFRSRGAKHLRILVFLRSDIYDSLRFDEKDKHRPLELPISWSADSLAEMVNKRLPEGVGVNELAQGGMRGGTLKPFNYIVARTFMRPREVLQFLGAAKDIAGNTADVIAGADILTAEKQYSTWKVEDLKQEYLKSDPSFATLLECLRQGRHRYESVDDLGQLIEAKAPQLLSPPEVTSRQLVERLFDYSIIGIRVGNSGKARYKSDEASLSLPTGGAVYVHPSLHQGLLIKEAKKSRRAKPNPTTEPSTSTM